MGQQKQTGGSGGQGRRFGWWREWEKKQIGEAFEGLLGILVQWKFTKIYKIDPKEVSK